MPHRPRCHLHGGRSYGPRGKAHGWHSGAWDARSRLQAQFRKLGVPWYGGRLSKRRVLRVAEKAVELAGQALEVIEARPVGELPGLVRDGMVAGLKLGKDTVTAVHEKLLELGIDDIDEKLLRLGNDTGMALCRLGIRAIEGEFRARRDDVLEKLLVQIAAAKGLAPPEK